VRGLDLLSGCPDEPNRLLRHAEGYPQRLPAGLLAQLHRRPGGADHQHVVPYALLVDVDTDNRIGAQLGRLLLYLGQHIADPAGQFVLIGPGPAASPRSGHHCPPLILGADACGDCYEFRLLFVTASHSG